MALSEKTLDRIAPRLMAGRPRAGRDPQHALDHVREISQNARATWFALLALMAFVGVTMMAHKDSDFFAAGVETALPLVGIDVPTTAFFIAAPLLLAAFYAYLHIYLIGLWDELAGMDERIGGERLFDRVLPTLISQTAVLYRSVTRPDDSAPERAFRGAMQAITVLLVWISAPALIGWVFVKSTAYHSTLLSGWIGLCFIAACLFGWEGWRVFTERLSGTPHAEVHAPWPPALRRRAARFGGGVLLLAWLFTSGLEPLIRWAADIAGYDAEDAAILTAARATLTRADLAEAELTRRPADWRPHTLWMEDFEERFREREGLGAADPLGAHDPAFRAEARQRYADYLHSLQTPELSSRDLRGADMRQAFLPGADLRWASMQGADLNLAEMQGANLSWVEMQGATLGASQMQNAVLWQADVKGSIFAFAQMTGTNLSWAKMEAAIFRGADLGHAEMRWANLRRSEMQGAYLSQTGMEGTDLREARLQGAILWGARMQRARCAGADFTITALHGTDFLCAGLQADQLRLAVGDNDTRLPDLMSVWSCLDRASLWREEQGSQSAVSYALQWYLESSVNSDRPSRADMHALIFCDPDHEDPLRRRPIPVGRWPMSEGPWPKGR